MESVERTGSQVGAAMNKRGTTVRAMFGSIAGRYDLANSVLSFGIHHLWRHALLNLVPSDHNLTVLDLCTGTGDLLRPLAARYGTVIGADFCLPMLKVEQSREKNWQHGFDVLQADAQLLPFADRSFDLVTVSFGVRNFENLELGLSEIARVLKPGGRLLVLEFGQPRNQLFGAIYRLYSDKVMPLIGGLVTGNRGAYQYLPKTSAQFPCGKEFEARLTSSGLIPKKYRALTFGICYAYLAGKA